MLVEILAVSRRSLSLPTYVQRAIVNENGVMIAELAPELPVGADRFAPEDSSTMQS